MAKDTNTTKKESNKVHANLRLSRLANDFIKSEIEERKKLRPKAKVTKTDIMEEALLRMAARDPEKRAKIIAALQDEPRFAAVLDFLRPKSEDNTKG